MWKFWTSVVPQDDVEDFEANFSQYYAVQGSEAARAIVAELYSQQSSKVTDADKKYYLLGVSGRITIDQRMNRSDQDNYEIIIAIDDQDSSDVNVAALNDLIDDIETLSADDMLGDLFRARYS